MPAVKKIRVESFDPLTNTSTVNGVVAITQGGTGATSASNALTNLLPSQGGYSGYYLNTNGVTATWAAVSGGGGGGGSVPKITNVQITDSSYNVLDDTAVSTTGGYIKITGTDFVSGCSVVIGNISASSVTFASSTTLNCQTPALTAGTYIVYVVNPDGGVGVRVNGLTASGLPDWQTASSLGEYSVDAVLSITLSAVEATSYVLQAGSSLPPGLSLSSGGVISGTPTGIVADTLYTFTVVAIDPQSQDSPRTFTITIGVTDPFFIYNSLLLRSDAAAQSFSTDASTNNFYATINGDVKGSEFTPYLTGWSNYFDGSGDFLSRDFTSLSDGMYLQGTTYTIEAWIYMTSVSGTQKIYTVAASNTTNFGLFEIGVISAVLSVTIRPTTGGSTTTISSGTIVANTWNHVAFSVNSGTGKLFLNGTQVGSNTTFVACTFTPANAGIGRFANGYTSGVTDFTGYISNLRIVQNTALYTSNFTPPTSPLTAIANTSLLTCQSNRFIDNSTNNFTITRNGDTSVTSFNPFNLYNTGTGGSAVFDGTSDSLVIVSNAAFAFGTNPYTVELWVYPTTLASTQVFVSASATGGFQFYFDTSNGIAVSQYGTAPFITTGLGHLVAAQWNHVAVSRSGTDTNQTIIFVNGTARITSTDNKNYTVQGPFYVGANTDGFSLNGYISNLRVIKGTAVYTTNFTPPTSLLTAITNTSLLTCQYFQSSNNNTFLDTSYLNNIVSRNGNPTTSTFTPFYNNYSVYFDGTGDSLTVPSNTWTTLAGQFTIEFWINYNPVSTSAGAQTGVFTAGGFNLYNDGTRLTPNIFGSGNIFASTLLWSSLTSGTWYHIAVTRDSANLMTIWLNGSSRGSATTSSTYTQGIWNISPSASYISNYRVTNTCLYTTSFTPSTSPLTAISGTNLLTCQSNRFIDNSTNNYTITRNGDTRVTKFSCFTLDQYYSVAQYGGSMYFDGTGDYLSISRNLLFLPVANEDFTVEAWVYLTATPGVQNAIVAGLGEYGTDSDWNLQINSSLQVSFYINAITTTFANTTTPITLNSWNHVAVSRSGTGSNNLRVFANGIGQSFTTNSTTVGSGNRALTIGADQNGDEANLTGYISNFRITKGTALYTANFTPLIIPVITPTAQTSLLLTGSAAGVYDATGINTIETVANASASAVQEKYALASMYFDGTGDYLALVGNPELQIRNKNFTIECWVYPTAATSNTITALDNVIATGYSAIRLRMTANRQIELLISSDGGSWAASGTTSTALSLNVWSYITVVRNGSGTNNIQVYINGNSALTLTFTGTAYTAASLRYSIGAVWSSSAASEFWTGYIEDLRLTNGVARYASNFTPPTVPNRRR